MGSPGGRVIARVQVKIAPNSAGFQAEVEKDLKELPDGQVKITAEVDDAKARAELDRLGSEGITITAEIDVDQGALAAEKALAKDPVTVPVNFDVDKGALDVERAVAGRPIHVPVEFDVDKNLFRAGFTGIIGDITSAFDSIEGSGARAASGIKSNFTDAFDGVGSAISSIGGPLLKAGAFATAFAVGGAAVAAAWGAVSTAVAAVPAAISLIGAPIAAVTLGLKGIQAAAKVLTPEFNKLKKSVSATFQAGLTPIFNQLKGSMTALTPSIQGVAQSMVGLAAQTANWITNLGGLQQIQTVFTNVAAAIKTINLVPLLDGLTKLAGNQAALSALTTTINTLGTEIDKIAANTSLNDAFKGLEGTLSAVTTGFGDLVNNGITLFAKAAPGVNATVSALTGFFNKFDWASLGKSVGGVFQGIADGINKIPPSTVEGITSAFQRLSGVFQSAQFQKDLTDIAAATPAVIDQIGSLTSTFVSFAAETGKLITSLNSLDQWFQRAQVSIGTKLFNLMGNAPGDIGKQLDTIPPVIKQHLGLLPPIFTAGGKASTNAYVSSIQGVPDQQHGILSHLPPVASSDLAVLPGIFGEGGAAAFAGFGTGLKPIHGALAAELQPLPGEAGTQLAPLATAGTTATQNMVNAVNAAIPGLGTAFQTGFTALGPLVTTAFQALSTTNVAAGMLAFSQAVTLGMVTVGAAFTQGFLGLTPIVVAGFAAIGTTAVAPGMLAISLAVTLGMVTIGAAFTQGFLGLTPIVVAGFAALGTTAVTPGMAAIALAVSLGMVTVGAAFTQGFTALGGVATAGMGAVSQAVSAGFVNVTAAVNAGFVGATGAATTGMTNIVAAVTKGGTDIVTAGTLAMTNLTKAITDGMTQVNTAIKTGMDTANKTATAAAASFSSVGIAIDQGIADGINSGSSIVQTAVKKVIAEAKAAADQAAKVNSPSRLFRDGTGLSIAEGLGDGILLGGGYVSDSARTVVMDAFEAAQKAVDTGGQLSINAAFDDIAARLNASISADDFTAKAPAIVATIPVTVDGKIVDSRVTTVIGEWEKDLLVGIRNA